MRYVMLVVLVVFFAFSSWVTLETSYLGAFPPFDDLNTLQIFCDLVISASLVILLLFRHRQKNDQAMWPIAVLFGGVALLGSIAILAYLVIDPDAIAAPET
jgi:cytochrome bd-type quinol oxidase subunit 2